MSDPYSVPVDTALITSSQHIPVEAIRTVSMRHATGVSHQLRLPTLPASGLNSARTSSLHPAVPS